MCRINSTSVLDSDGVEQVNSLNKKWLVKLCKNAYLLFSLG